MKLDLIVDLVMTKALGLSDFKQHWYISVTFFVGYLKTLSVSRIYSIRYR
jgi:hypothetical protein